MGASVSPSPPPAHSYEGGGSGIDCRTASDGRVIADIVRLDKGHTEGLEPHVVDTIRGMIVAAPGGKACALLVG